MDVSAILIAAQSSDPTTRTQAESVLSTARDSDFPSYCGTLATHLASETADAESRRLAGIILKNLLDGKTRATREAYSARWLALDNGTVRPAVRACLMQALASPVPQARRAAAQVVAKVAGVELVAGEWEGLVAELLGYSTGEGSADHLRQAALETLGFICEDAGAGVVDSRVLSAHSNQILTALVHGMQYGQVKVAVEGETAEEAQAKVISAAAVRLTATKSLNDALEFANAQFEVPNERTAIVETVYKAAKSADLAVNEAALMGLCKIGEHYYDKLPDFMQWLFEVTEQAIRSEHDAIALQGIEFWNTIADEEIALAEDEESSAEMGLAPVAKNKKFVEAALSSLTPPILECLKHQDEDPLEDDAWNRATAAGVCLELLAQAAPTTILPLVIPFVQANIVDATNWRSRDAAILAFGAVLEGPSHNDLKPLVRDIFGPLMNSLVADTSIPVRDTTAWTLGRAVQTDRELTMANLPALVECLRSSLTTSAENPVLAGHICFALHNLAETFIEDAENETGPLRDHTEVILRALLVATSREDGGEGNLRTNAYEALGMMLNALSRDSLHFVLSLLPRLLDKLEVTLNALSSDLAEDDMNEIVEVQGLLCGALLQATQRLAGGQGLDQFADRLMNAYLGLLSYQRQGAQEEAMCALATLARSVGPNFAKYMQHVMTPLSEGLSNHEQYSLCRVSNAAVQDICTALGPGVVPYADNIVYLMLAALQSSVLDKTVKPPILSCFGDIATAVQGEFEKYLPQVMNGMQQAAQSTVRDDVPDDDYDMLDWLLTLRESIFDAYIGIIHGLSADNKQQLLLPYVDWILQFSEIVVAPSSAEEVFSLTKAATTTLGDLVSALPQIKADLANRSWIGQLLDRGGLSKDPVTREVSGWARTEIFAA